MTLARALRAGALLATALLGIGSAVPARAEFAYPVLVNTTGLNEMQGYLDFQFNQFGSDSLTATAAVSQFAGNGTLAGTSTNTNATGTLPGVLTIPNTTGFNDIFQGITFGTFLSFQVAFAGPALNNPQGATTGSSFAFSLSMVRTRSRRSLRARAAKPTGRCVAQWHAGGHDLAVLPEWTRSDGGARTFGPDPGPDQPGRNRRLCPKAEPGSRVDDERLRTVGRGPSRAAAAPPDPGREVGCQSRRNPMQATLILLTSLLLAAQDAPSDAVRDELARHQGTWAVTSYVYDGKESPQEVARSIRRIVQGYHVVWERDGKPFAGTSLALDPTRVPHALDVVPDEGLSKGKRVLGIYKLEGGTLTICMADADRDRPTSFSSEPGSGRMLMILERAEPAGSDRPATPP